MFTSEIIPFERSGKVLDEFLTSLIVNVKADLSGLSLVENFLGVSFKKMNNLFSGEIFAPTI
jgi:hypothetical protein